MAVAKGPNPTDYYRKITLPVWLMFYSLLKGQLQRYPAGTTGSRDGTQTLGYEKKL